MSTSTLRDQALSVARELEAEFVASLKGQVPGEEEAAALTWAAQTIAAAPLLGSTPDLVEQVSKAKGILLNLASAHEIDAATATATMIHSAVSKAAAVLLPILLAA